MLCSGRDDNGGQSGHARTEQNQLVNPPATKNSGLENTSELEAVPNRVMVAAVWLSLHRDTIVGAPIPVVRAKFDLSPLDAVEALKRGRDIRYGARDGIRKA